MKRRTFLTSALATALLPASLAAQPAAKVARIGWLTAQRPASLAPYLDAMRAGLAGLGYVEGKNLTIEYRFADDDIERIPALAAELVRMPVSMILAQGAAVPAIANLNLPVPIVYVVSADPVSAGYADSLAHPRGNMTGLTFMAAEFNSKRIELLHDLIPDLQRVALVGHPEHPGEHLERADTEEAAKRFGITIRYFATRSRAELDAALARIAEEQPQAISVFSDGFAVQNGRTIIDFANSRGIPVIAGWAVFAENGALCSYGPKLSESYRRLANYVDRILKGAKPADLPIERPTHFELVLNLRTAKALNIAMPPALVARADQLIE
jgi:putative tryptophan/tyrosine transport system substrate-binding protein